MAKHNEYLEKYPEGFQDIARELGDLRYDTLAEFLDLLSKKLAKDAVADAGRNRIKLSHELEEASKRIMEASKNIDKAWEICEPYM